MAEQCCGLYQSDCAESHSNTDKGPRQQTFIFSQFWRLQAHDQSAGKFDFWLELSSLLLDGPRPTELVPHPYDHI